MMEERAMVLRVHHDAQKWHFKRTEPYAQTVTFEKVVEHKDLEPHSPYDGGDVPDPVTDFLKMHNFEIVSRTRAESLVEAM